MEFIEIVGYLAALLVGVVLGLLGGGGSILTVPILVYTMALNPVIATAYSLFIVGTTSLVGTVKNIKNKRVDFRIATIFAIPAFTAVYLTRAFIIPAIPEVIFSNEKFILSKDIAIMLFFAVVMLIASISMIRDNNATIKEKPVQDPATIILICYGFVIGLVTGMVGAGGGFLIVPALLFFARLSMKKAVATSLLIIAVNSLIGFSGDLLHSKIDWLFLLTFSGLSIIGIFIGIWLNRFIDGKKLKKSFGWFVLVMAIYIMYNELKP